MGMTVMTVKFHLTFLRLHLQGRLLFGIGDGTDEILDDYRQSI